MKNSSNHNLLLAGGVFSQLPPNCLLVRGQGGKLWDDQGNSYTDLIMGYGAVSIGHGEPQVIEALTAQAKQGTMLPGRTKVEEKARQYLHDLFPHTTSASLHKTGSEAVAAAIRMARCVTGRQLIVRCGFHGWHDEMIQSSRRWHSADVQQMTLPKQVCGIRDGDPPLEWIDSDPNSLAAILDAHPQEIAAVMIDPVQIRTNISETFTTVKAMCERSKVLLILDELKTCPRVAMGGVQELFGVKADLTIVGKGLANGFAFSAVLGPDWMEAARRESRIMGTFNGELSGLAALTVSIEILRQEEAPLQLAKLGDWIITQTNELLSEKNLSHRAKVTPGPWPCMPQINITSFSEQEEKLGQFAAKHGACILHPHINFICLRHSFDDLHRAASAIVAAVAEI